MFHSLIDFLGFFLDRNENQNRLILNIYKTLSSGRGSVFSRCTELFAFGYSVAVLSCVVQLRNAEMDLRFTPVSRYTKSATPSHYTASATRKQKCEIDHARILKKVQRSDENA